MKKISALFFILLSTVSLNVLAYSEAMSETTNKAAYSGQIIMVSNDTTLEQCDFTKQIVKGFSKSFPIYLCVKK